MTLEERMEDLEQEQQMDKRRVSHLLLSVSTLSLLVAKPDKKIAKIPLIISLIILVADNCMELYRMISNKK